MYLLSIVYQNARLNGTGEFSPRRSNTSIAKWTLLEAGDHNLELLRLIVASCSSPVFLHRIPFSFNLLHGTDTGPLLAAHLRALHSSTDNCQGRNTVVSGGLRINAAGKAQPLSRSRDVDFFPKSTFRNPLAKSKPGRDFLLAYGSDFTSHNGGDAFDFADPFFRTRRFESLFSPSAAITDPAAFLGILFHRGGRNKRHVPLNILKKICRLMHQHFQLNVHHWLKTPLAAEREWSTLPPKLRKPLALLLDAVRHTMDAFPKVRTPLDLPGLILLHQPDRYCEEGLLAAWLAFFDELFPSMQFIMTVPAANKCPTPKNLLTKELDLPLLQKTQSSTSRAGGNADVLLIDVDSRLPNLALMKLSRHFKEQGRRVVLARGASQIRSARQVFASCVFTSAGSTRKVEALKDFYGDSLQMGGSGIDARGRLPAEIEALAPDYELYPELQDRALGFLSRGCPLHCPFCIVPLKEGPPRQVSDLHTLLEGGRRSKLILLDDNLLSLPRADQLLEEMASRQIMVNFTQTLDLRFVDRSKAELLRRIRCSNTRFTRSNYYFSLNDSRSLDLVREKYDLFGFASKDNVAFVCMYGFNTTLAEDLRRFRFLRTLPGAYVFTQKYQPVPGGPQPDIARFFEGDPDRMIAELIKIEFTQNMKSMETYYRWISRGYAQTFGKLHMPLVDTIFRYNRKHMKGRYIATLAGLNG